MMKHAQPSLSESVSSTWQPSDSADTSVKRRRTLTPTPGAELSIIVPTFNERENVAELVQRLHSSLIGCSWEVIFVGFSVKRGVLQAQGQYILFSDADLSTPIEELERLLQCIVARN
jgi:hypothetical protein